MERVVRACIRRIATWLDHKGQELERVTPEEIGNAVRVLYGTRHERRKHQRKRRHVTYKQRDAIAWLLIRLQQERRHNTMSMTRQEWVNYFCEYMSGLSDYTDQDIADAAEINADDQHSRTGSDDAAMWQNPGAAAQKVLNEWHRDESEAAEETPPEPTPLPGGEPTPPSEPESEPASEPASEPESAPPPAEEASGTARHVEDWAG